MNLSRLLGCCIALFSAGAFAQENPLLLRVPLFSPGPPIAAADPIHQIPQTKTRDFVAMKAVVLNEDAFGAGAVTVEIDGNADAMRLQCMEQAAHGNAIGLRGVPFPISQRVGVQAGFGSQLRLFQAGGFASGAKMPAVK